jgi:hypothetical protein
VNIIEKRGYWKSVEWRLGCGRGDDGRQRRLLEGHGGRDPAECELSSTTNMIVAPYLHQLIFFGQPIISRLVSSSFDNTDTDWQLSIRFKFGVDYCIIMHAPFIGELRQWTATR